MKMSLRRSVCTLTDNEKRLVGLDIRAMPFQNPLYTVFYFIFCYCTLLYLRYNVTLGHIFFVFI